MGTSHTKNKKENQKQIFLRQRYKTSLGKRIKWRVVAKNRQIEIKLPAAVVMVSTSYSPLSPQPFNLCSPVSFPASSITAEMLPSSNATANTNSALWTQQPEEAEAASSLSWSAPPRIAAAAAAQEETCKAHQETDTIAAAAATVGKTPPSPSTTSIAACGFHQGKVP